MYPGIGLIEVLWKLIAIITNCRLAGAIKFHDILHGIWSKRGTWTSTLESNLPHNIYGLYQYVIYEIFMDTHRAYDSLCSDKPLRLCEDTGWAPRFVDCWPSIGTRW